MLFKNKTYIVQISKIASQTITLSRFPLAVMVVFIHSVGDLNAPYAHLRDFISHPLLSFVVPAFFIMSGYLFFLNIEDKPVSVWYKYKIKNRVKTLLIPYICWNLVTLMLDFLKYVRHSACWINYDNTSVWSIVYKTFLDYQPIDLPLWYIRDLILLVIISPILYNLLRRFACLSIIAIAIWYFIGIKVLINPVSMLFFSLGGLLAIKNEDLLMLNKKWKITLAIFVVCIFPVFLFFDSSVYVARIYAVFMPFVFFHIINYFSSNISVKKMGVALSKYSEIIYYSHYPITLIVAISFVSKILPNYTLVNYFAIPLLAIMLSMTMKILYDKIKTTIS